MIIILNSIVNKIGWEGDLNDHLMSTQIFTFDNLKRHLYELQIFEESGYNLYFDFGSTPRRVG